jgi:hypothetical protein
VVLESNFLNRAVLIAALAVTKTARINVKQAKALKGKISGGKICGPGLLVLNFLIDVLYQNQKFSC